MTNAKNSANIVGAMIAMANATTRRLSGIFPGYFPEAKHDHYKDFGWPDTLTFQQFYDAWTRNGLARAAVEKTVSMCWQDKPFLAESEDKHKETELEGQIRQRFDDLRLWQRLATADRRSMVGRYSGVILRLADSKRFLEPVDVVPGGIDGLVEIIPAWEGQLTVAEWDSDELSETYGQPKMYSFNEAAVGSGEQGKARSFEVHPDRVLIWSEDGTVHCRSALEAGYNDLLTLEKISGAGGEGFWKNAKSAPVIEIDKEAQLDQMAQAMGVAKADLVEAMNDQVDDWQKGFDKLLMLQGMQAKTLSITLPSPEHFRAGPLETFAASVQMPVKILVGMQTGERASTEDASEWAKTCMGRRSDLIIPLIMQIVNRLEAFGILPERDWFLSWSDLTEANMAQRIERAHKMADVNAKMASGGELVFLPEEIRDVIGLEPVRATIDQ